MHSDDAANILQGTAPARRIAGLRLRANQLATGDRRSAHFLPTAHPLPGTPVGRTDTASSGRRRVPTNQDYALTAVATSALYGRWRKNLSPESKKIAGIATPILAQCGTGVSLTLPLDSTRRITGEARVCLDNGAVLGELRLMELEMTAHRRLFAAMAMATITSALVGCGASNGNAASNPAEAPAPSPAPTITGISTPSQVSVVTAK